jgi:cytidine deaminase
MEKNMDNKSYMLELAIKAQQNAYAPYSKFKVGVCILSENNQYFSGCNIENASYPQGWCAEPSAISAMIMGSEKNIKEILVIGSGDLLCSPCGGCRQKIREFANENTIVHMAIKDKIVQSVKLHDLLPLSFGPENLKP